MLLVSVSKRCEPRRQSRVVDPFWLQLTIDVGGQAHRAHALDVARRGAETDAVQHVNDRAVVRLLRNGRLDLLSETGRCRHTATVTSDSERMAHEYTHE